MPGSPGARAARLSAASTISRGAAGGGGGGALLVSSGSDDGAIDGGTTIEGGFKEASRPLLRVIGGTLAVGDLIPGWSRLEVADELKTTEP